MPHSEGAARRQKVGGGWRRGRHLSVCLHLASVSSDSHKKFSHIFWFWAQTHKMCTTTQCTSIRQPATAVQSHSTVCHLWIHAMAWERYTCPFLTDCYQVTRGHKCHVQKVGRFAVVSRVKGSIWVRTFDKWICRGNSRTIIVMPLAPCATHSNWHFCQIYRTWESGFRRISSSGVSSCPNTHLGRNVDYVKGLQQAKHEKETSNPRPPRDSNPYLSVKKIQDQNIRPELTYKNALAVVLLRLLYTTFGNM